MKIIRCPSCKTSFEVPDDAISQEGRKVRCSNCLNIWHAKLDQPEEKATSVVSIEQKSEDHHSLFLLTIIPVISLTVILLTYLQFNKENLSDNSFGCSKLKICNFVGLEVTEIKFINDEKHNLMNIKYTIQNKSNRIISVPFVKFEFVGKENNYLGAKIVKSNSLYKIYQNESKNFVAEAKIYENINNVNITIGNWIDVLIK
jgi:predicted Zn finger-like uncharacterized protein